jgi:hypothetical protein
VERRWARAVLPHERWLDDGRPHHARPEFVGSLPSRLFTTRMLPHSYLPQYAVTADGKGSLGNKHLI